MLAALSLGMAAVPLHAAFESVAVEITAEPQLPLALVQGGLRKARIVIAVDVAADGRLVDWLVVSATHEELIRPCTEAVAQWRFKPARYNGEPVPAQVSFTIDISQNGAVVSRTAFESAEHFIADLTGRQPDYTACPASEMDRPLVAITRLAPRYATEAAQSGITGRVRVQFYVDEQGTVRMPAVAPDADPYLSAAAVAAMRGWRFAPPTSRGRPVLVAAEQEFVFGGVK